MVDVLIGLHRRAVGMYQGVVCGALMGLQLEAVSMHQGVAFGCCFATLLATGMTVLDACESDY